MRSGALICYHRRPISLLVPPKQKTWLRPCLGRSPWHFQWMSRNGQGTKCRRNIAENLNRLSRAHERYRRQTTDRRQTDGRAIAYSEREREFTFAKNQLKQSIGILRRSDKLSNSVEYGWKRKTNLPLLQHAAILQPIFDSMSSINQTERPGRQKRRADDSSIPSSHKLHLYTSVICWQGNCVNCVSSAWTCRATQCQWCETTQ